MFEAPQVHALSPKLAVWHAYDAAVKADLFSTKLGTPSGTFLIDPIPLNPADLKALLGPVGCAAILVTNANHVRESADFSTRLDVSIYAHPEARPAFEGGKIIEFAEHLPIAPNLSVIAIEGAAPGEIALHYAGDGGILVFGDALINTGSYGFAFLPNKYCTNGKLMRRSLKRVLEFDFERILFAHGAPIVSQARVRLAELLTG